MKDYSGVVFAEIVVMVFLLLVVSNRVSMAWFAFLGQAKVVAS